MKATVPIFIITAMLTACTTSGGHGVDLSAILEPVAERREIEIYPLAPSARTALNRSEPLTVTARSPVRVYALLWRWDYGFLSNHPSGDGGNVDGWTLERLDGARVAGAPEPFATLPLYSRELLAGTHRLPVSSYYGQWIYVGIREIGSAVPVGGTILSATIPEGVTRHNIVMPGVKVTVSSDQEITQITLYHRGKKIGSTEVPSITAPDEPGRYLLEAWANGVSTVIPVTVGYRMDRTPGWPGNFFPIHFYNGWGYTGLFKPNPALLSDLQTMAMFELGANTFFVTSSNPIAEALGARIILNIRKETKYFVRSIPDDTVSEERFTQLMEDLVPFPDGTLGLYVEDEPGTGFTDRLRMLERVSRRTASGIPLLYSLHGQSAPEVWTDAESTVRMTRSYPIRKKRRDDLGASIRTELADYLAACQTAAPEGRLWLVAQSFGDLGKPDVWDQPTPSQLKLMVNLALGRGIRGITYFCFDSSPKARERLTALAVWPYVPQDHLYDEVGVINAGIRAMEAFLTSVRWIGEIPQGNHGFDVQLLESSDVVTLGPGESIVMDIR